MAYGKDYWAIDPVKLKSHPYQTTMYADEFTPADQELSLTETLDKPLYEFSEGELYDLVDELKAVRWGEKETQVKEIVRNFMMEYRSRGNPANAMRTNTKYITMALPVRGFRTIPHSTGATMPSTVHSTANHVTISIPTSLPSEFVHAFVERMVRDYFEEA